MGIRQTLNEKPAIAYGAFGGLLLIAVVFGVWYMRSGNPVGPTITKPVGDQAYYSDDDGKTTFVDALQKATPFKHGGKDAVRAMVFKCSSGSQFTVFLVRHTELGRQQKGISLEIGNRPTYSDHPLEEVKKPGDKDWLPVTPANMAKATKVMSPICPSNPNEVPQPAFPSGS